MDLHVVVTGGSSGIGRAVGRAFGRIGATVWLGARREAELREAAREVDAAGGTGRHAPLDVTDPASVERFAASVAAGGPGVDVLVNNAGIGGWGRMEALDLATWRRVMDTNAAGPFLVTKAMLPLLRKRSGRRHVVNVVSVAGKLAFAGNGLYAASKHALRAWTESVAAELAEEGIRVTAVLPGFVATPMVRKGGRAADMIQPDDLAEYIVGLTRLPESLHVDEVVAWPWRMYTE